MRACTAGYYCLGGVTLPGEGPRPTLVLLDIILCAGALKKRENAFDFLFDLIHDVLVHHDDCLLQYVRACVRVYVQPVCRYSVLNLSRLFPFLVGLPFQVSCLSSFPGSIITW
jgi:hypothetical protein